MKTVTGCQRAMKVAIFVTKSVLVRNEKYGTLSIYYEMFCMVEDVPNNYQQQQGKKLITENFFRKNMEKYRKTGRKTDKQTNVRTNRWTKCRDTNTDKYTIFYLFASNIEEYLSGLSD